MVPDQVMRQEAAEQDGPLAGAIGQDLRHQAPVIVIDDRLRHCPKEGKGVDVAVHPSLGHSRRIGADVTGVAVRQIQNKEVGLLLDTANLDHRLAEVGLRMARGMRQRHEHFLAPPFSLPDVILDDRVAAGEPALVTKPVEHPLRRVPLLPRHGAIRLKPALDDRDKGIKLRPPDFGRPPVARRHRERHHLRNRITGDVEGLRRLTLAHACRAGLANPEI